MHERTKPSKQQCTAETTAASSFLFVLRSNAKVLVLLACIMTPFPCPLPLSLAPSLTAGTMGPITFGISILFVCFKGKSGYRGLPVELNSYSQGPGFALMHHDPFPVSLASLSSSLSHSLATAGMMGSIPFDSSILIKISVESVDFSKVCIKLQRRIWFFAVARRLSSASHSYLVCNYFSGWKNKFVHFLGEVSA